VTVDEFVEKNVQPEFRGIVAEIRTLMRQNAPKAKEVISYNLPMYVIRKPIAWISPSKTGISLGFREGASFDDKYGLLKAESRHSKKMKMKTLKDVDKTALRSYIKQAVAIENE